MGGQLELGVSGGVVSGHERGPRVVETGQGVRHGGFTHAQTLEGVQRGHVGVQEHT
jgi:hypothetical protein